MAIGIPPDGMACGGRVSGIRAVPCIITGGRRKGLG